MGRQDQLEQFQKTINRLNSGIKALPGLIRLLEENDLLCGNPVERSLANDFKPLIGHNIFVDFLDREDDDPECAYVSMIYVDHPNDTRAK